MLILFAAVAGSKKKDKPSGAVEVKNRNIFHKYTVNDRFEAGLILQGTEVKAFREGKAQISEAFVRVDKGKAILYHAHIEEYSFGNRENHNPVRPRELLLHKREILKLQTAVQLGGAAIIPVRMYLKHGLVKVEIALCKGKKLFDKREDIKRKTQEREIDRAIKARR